MRFFLALSLALLLSACSGAEAPKTAAIPVYTGPIDPPDEVAATAIQNFLKSTGAPAASTFQISRFDLDDDGRRDALVLLKTPYGYWCDMHGCTMLVLKASDNNFTLVNAIQPIRTPLYISDIESNGWKSLLVRVSGRWDPAKDVAMMYNGHGYPDNPDQLPPYPKGARDEYVRVFE